MLPNRISCYIAPVIIFLAIAFGMSNAGNNIAVRKLVAGVVIVVLIGMVFELFAVDLAQAESYQVERYLNDAVKDIPGVA